MPATEQRERRGSSLHPSPYSPIADDDGGWRRTAGSTLHLLLPNTDAAPAAAPLLPLSRFQSRQQSRLPLLSPFLRPRINSGGKLPPFVAERGEVKIQDCREILSPPSPPIHRSDPVCFRSRGGGWIRRCLNRATAPTATLARTTHLCIIVPPPPSA